MNQVSQPLNILLLFPHFDSLEQSGSMRSWQIGRFLASRGHNVTVFAPGVDSRSGELFPEVRGKLYWESQVDGARLIRPYSLPHFRRSAFRRLGKEIVYGILAVLKSFTISNVDIVVAAYPPAVTPALAYLMARICQVPIIFEIRDLMADALSATRYVKSGLFNRIALFVEQYIAKHSDHVICVSQGIKRIIQSRGVDESRITVVTNGYEPEVFEAADYSWNPRERFGWEDRFVVIYAGGLTQSYDIPTLLRAAKLLRNEKDLLFVIVGEGDRKQEYQQFCREHSLDNCQFIGRRPRREMPVFFAAADLGVHLFPDNPLWAYVLGNKTFDYLGSGLPMLYAGTGDTANLIREAQAGLVVKPENEQEFAEAIMWFKTHPVESRAMGRRGRDFVMKHYLRPKLSQTFESTLLKVVRREFD